MKPWQALVVALCLAFALWAQAVRADPFELAWADRDPKPGDVLEVEHLAAPPPVSISLWQPMPRWLPTSLGDSRAWTGCRSAAVEVPSSGWVRARVRRGSVVSDWSKPLAVPEPVLLLPAGLAVLAGLARRRR